MYRAEIGAEARILVRLKIGEVDHGGRRDWWRDEVGHESYDELMRKIACATAAQGHLQAKARTRPQPPFVSSSSKADMVCAT